uniref:Uncharacterized protein n=1 Tax=Lactuca sativa TaxID=4236 RepID=A0A9R1UXX9_LACSA|nr:hypothetical protein LSAT_V11C700379750 [Lactuca sativa]
MTKVLSPERVHMIHMILEIKVASMVDVLVNLTTLKEGASVARRLQRQLLTNKLKTNGNIEKQPSFQSYTKKMLHNAVMHYVVLICKTNN